MVIVELYIPLAKCGKGSVISVPVVAFSICSLKPRMTFHHMFCCQGESKVVKSKRFQKLFFNRENSEALVIRSQLN